MTDEKESEEIVAAITQSTGTSEVEPIEVVCVALVSKYSSDQIRTGHHQSEHPGIKRIMYFARQIDPAVSKAMVRIIVKECQECQSNNPPLARWSSGKLNVDGTLTQLGINITLYDGTHYLTLIDCDPTI